MSGYATPRPEGSRLRASGQRDREKLIRDVCERSVGEMNEGRDTTERTRETRERAEKGEVVREKERGPLKITSYTLFQTDHLR